MSPPSDAPPAVPIGSTPPIPPIIPSPYRISIPPPAQLPYPPQPRAKKKSWWLVWVLAILALIIVLASVSGNRRQALAAAPRLVEGAQPNPAEAILYTYSAEQQEVIDAFGYPDSFSILFYYEEFDPDYSGMVRDELWRFFSAGQAIVFYNGELIASEDINDPPTTWLPTLYHPGMFTARAGLEGVLASAGVSDFFELPLEEALLDKGTLYYAPGLSFGLVDDCLVYVETILVAEEGGSSD